jgi:hypothetical protein
MEKGLHFWKKDTKLKLHALDSAQTFKSVVSQILIRIEAQEPSVAEAISLL